MIKVDALLHKSVLHSQTVPFKSPRAPSLHLLLNIDVAPPQALVKTSIDTALKFQLLINKFIKMELDPLSLTFYIGFKTSN